MSKRRRDPWLDVALDAWTLSLEAASVVGLRMARIAAGGEGAAAEA